jgi:hypothetical protein
MRLEAITAFVLGEGVVAHSVQNVNTSARAPSKYREKRLLLALHTTYKHTSGFESFCRCKTLETTYIIYVVSSVKHLQYF